MLGLTIRQPWASAVVRLGKDVENRTWTTPYRGPIAIHAGRSVDRAAHPRVGNALRQRLPSGCVVAVATLCDIVRDSDSIWAGDGFYHWILSDVQELAEPVPCIGRQLLFKLPLDVERAVERGLAASNGRH